jgi:hypothetical protein
MYPTIEALEALANSKNVVLYNICNREAGWAFQWYEESRVKTPLPAEVSPRVPDSLKEYTAASSARAKEGLVIYKYYPTLSEAIKAEFERLENIK